MSKTEGRKWTKSESGVCKKIWRGCPNRQGQNVISMKETHMTDILMAYLDEAGWPKMTKDEQEQGMAAYIAYPEALTKAAVLARSSRLQPSLAPTTVPLSACTPR